MLSPLKLFRSSTTAPQSSDSVGKSPSTRSVKTAADDLLPSNKATEDIIIPTAQKVSRFLPRHKMQVGFDAPALDKFSIFEHVHPSDAEELLRLAHKDVQGKRSMGALVCMAVADSVGHNFEFLPVGQKGCHWNPRTLRATGVYNKFNLKAGQWTDDTSMGLCLADSLLCKDGYDGTDQRVRFWNWWNRGYNNAFRLDNERKGSVGLGTNIAASLSAITNADPPPRFEAICEDAGNGSLMRLAPIPVYYHKDVETAIEASIESSFTTHPGPIAANACGFLGYLIMRAIRRKSRSSIKKFLDAIVEEYLARPEVQSQKELVRLLKSNEPANSTERCWNWRDSAGPYLEEVVKARGNFYNGYPVSAGYMGAFSMDGLAIAMHSVYHTTSLMSAIAKCVNCLGDSDSTGAICGQIAGAFYGVDAIDSRLLDNLRKWDCGEIALRGALLWALGKNLPSEDTDGNWRDPRPKRLRSLSSAGNSEDAEETKQESPAQPPKSPREETAEVPEKVPEKPESDAKLEVIQEAPKKPAPKKDHLTLPIKAVDGHAKKIPSATSLEIPDSCDEGDSVSASKLSEDDVHEDLDDISPVAMLVERDPNLSPAKIRTQLSNGDVTLMRDYTAAEVQDEPRLSARGERSTPLADVILEAQNAANDALKENEAGKADNGVANTQQNTASDAVKESEAAKADNGAANKQQDSASVAKKDAVEKAFNGLASEAVEPKAFAMIGSGPCPRGPSCFQLPVLPDVEQLDQTSDPVPPCPLPSRPTLPGYNGKPAINGKPASTSGHRSLPPGAGGGRTPFIQSI